jgi:putative inorganic carbon (HCO3(-)) transporter
MAVYYLNRENPAAAALQSRTGGWRDVFATAAIALLAPVLPLFLGGRTPFAIAYLSDGLQAAVMAIVLVVTFWSGTRALSSPREQRLWIGSAVVFSIYIFLQVLPLPLLPGWLGPYPAALKQLPGWSPATWSPNPGATLLGWTQFLALWTVAWCARTLPSRYLGWLLLAFAASSLFQAVYGLLAQAAGSTTVLGLWPRVNPSYLSGTFTHRNLFGGYMSLTGPLVILLWWLPDIPGVSKLPQPMRIAGTVFCAAVVTMAMFGTGSRMGVMAGGIALLVSGYLWFYRHGASVRQQTWSAVGMAAVVILVLLWFGPALILDRLVEMGVESSRWDVWRLMLTRFPVHYWFFGIGLGGFEAAFRTIQSTTLTSWYFDAHCDLLQWLLETGVIGAALLVIVAAGLWRRRRISRLRAPLYGGLAAIAFIGLVDFSWHMAGTQLIIATYIGILLRPERIKRQ